MPASTEADSAETAKEASEEPELTDEQKSEALIKQLMAEEAAEQPPQKSTYEELLQAQIEHER